MNPLHLVIGGSSCVGKTTVARHLCERLNLKLVETDRTLPNNPLLRPLDGALDIWDRPTMELRDLLIKAANSAVPYLREQIVTLSGSPTGWIMEGERVHPDLAERGLGEDDMQAVFIIETDARRLYRTLMERLPGFSDISEARRRAVAEVDQLYNLWLEAEAASRNLVCVESQPWQSLADRVVAVVAQGSHESA
ncbi:MAG TPA: hypothetical protein VF779_04160 [Pyrinomonadaceae bacterium]